MANSSNRNTPALASIGIEIGRGQGGAKGAPAGCGQVIRPLLVKCVLHDTLPLAAVGLAVL